MANARRKLEQEIYEGFNMIPDNDIERLTHAIELGKKIEELDNELIMEGEWPMHGYEVDLARIVTDRIREAFEKNMSKGADGNEYAEKIKALREKGIQDLRELKRYDFESYQDYLAYVGFNAVEIKAWETEQAGRENFVNEDVLEKDPQNN